MTFRELLELLQELEELERERQQKERIRRIANVLRAKAEGQKHVAEIVGALLKEAQDNKYTLKNHSKAKDAIKLLRG